MQEQINIQKYLDYILDKTQKILAIDSPSGFTKKATNYIMEEYAALGYTPTQTTKGGILCEISSNTNAQQNNALIMEAHIDTLGAMVCAINPNGCLALSPIGGMNANNA